jgi:hypothetical protein
MIDPPAMARHIPVDQLCLNLFEDIGERSNSTSYALNREITATGKLPWLKSSRYDPD